MDWLAFSLVSNLVRKHILNLVISYLFGLTQTKQTTIQWCPQKIFWQSHVTFSLFNFCGTSSNFISVQLWLGGKVGLENFSITPMLRDPPYLFSHPTQGGIENGSCLQITRQLSRHHQQVEKPLTYSFARMRNCELAMTPDQSIQGMRKKEIKYQRDLSKIGLWTILICEYGVFCKYIFIYTYLIPPFVGHLI